LHGGSFLNPAEVGCERTEGLREPAMIEHHGTTPGHRIHGYSIVAGKQVLHRIANHTLDVPVADLASLVESIENRSDV
jgi:hypothetical protein